MKGFSVEVVFCETCSETAEGIPDGSYCKGLPEGWVVVQASRYTRTRGDGMTGPWKRVRTVYYCSESHLPADLLPETVQRVRER